MNEYRRSDFSFAYSGSSALFCNLPIPTDALELSYLTKRVGTMDKVLIVTATKVETEEVLAQFCQAPGAKGEACFIGRKTYYRKSGKGQRERWHTRKGGLREPPDKPRRSEKLLEATRQALTWGVVAGLQR